MQNIQLSVNNPVVVATPRRKSASNWGWLMALILISVMVLSACGQKKEDTEKNNEPQDKVNIQLSWTRSVASVPYYIAHDKGFYADKNIDVRIVEGGINENGEFIVPINEVVAGNAQFGIVDGANLIDARQQGIPVVAIAASIQRHPTPSPSTCLSSRPPPLRFNPTGAASSPIPLTFLRIFTFSRVINLFSPSPVGRGDRGEGRYDLTLIGATDNDITPDLAALESAIDENTALVTLSHVVFKSGYMYDMKYITGLAHAKGALVLWDLSHSAGSVPVELDACNADLAIGCTYKYLNGGPGAPAFLYVNQNIQEKLSSPIWGWWGQKNPFDFNLEYTHAPGLQRFLVAE